MNGDINNLVKNYKISRVAKDLYIVKLGNEIVKECSTYKQAEDFIFITQAKELVYEFRDAV
jgi:hypothetical protein